MEFQLFADDDEDDYRRERHKAAARRPHKRPASESDAEETAAPITLKRPRKLAKLQKLKKPSRARRLRLQRRRHSPNPRPTRTTTPPPASPPAEVRSRSPSPPPEPTPPPAPKQRKKPLKRAPKPLHKALKAAAPKAPKLHIAKAPKANVPKAPKVNALKVNVPKAGADPADRKKEITKLQNQFRNNLQTLRTQIIAVEKQNTKLTAALRKRDPCVTENLDDIRRPAFLTGKYPLRMCICGKYATSFRDVPNDLLAKVIGHVDAISRQKLRRLSRSFKEVIEHPDVKKSVLFATHTTLFPPPDAEPDKLSDFLENLYAFSLSADTQTLLLDLRPATPLAPQPKKTLPPLDRPFAATANDLRNRILPLCPNLQRLVLCHARVLWSDLLHLPSSVEEVWLVRCYLVDDTPEVYRPEVFENGVLLREECVGLGGLQGADGLREELGNVMNGALQAEGVKPKHREKIIRAVPALAKMPEVVKIVGKLLALKEAPRPRWFGKRLDIAGITPTMIHEIQPCTRRCLYKIAKYFCPDK